MSITDSPTKPRSPGFFKCNDLFSCHRPASGDACTVQTQHSKTLTRDSIKQVDGLIPRLTDYWSPSDVTEYELRLTIAQQCKSSEEEGGSAPDVVEQEVQVPQDMLEEEPSEAEEEEEEHVHGDVHEEDEDNNEVAKALVVVVEVVEVKDIP